MKNSDDPWKQEWKEGEQIGCGGQGLIIELQGKTDPTKRAVLKRLADRWRGNDQAKERMIREIESMVKLNGVEAKVPKVINSFIEHPGSEPFFTMEHISGVLFKEWLERNAPTSILEAASITKEIAKTIELCHSQNIGHRDLKPANIILKNDDPSEPYVLDFGISFDSMQSIMVTKEGEVFWNEFITLPECQDRLGGHQDHRSDITALAGIFFNCIVGEPPAVLLDKNGMPPQKRYFDKLKAAAKDSSELMRLRSFFDVAFSVALSHRFQDLPTFLQQLDNFNEQHVDRETLADISKFYLGNLLERDRGAQLATLATSAAKLVTEVNSSLSQRIQSESLSELKLQSKTFDATNFVSSNSNTYPASVATGDRLLGNNLQFLILSSENHPRSAVCTVVVFAVGMNIRIVIGGWVSSGSNKFTKPISGVDWLDVGSVDQSASTAEKIELVRASVEGAYTQFKNQVRKLSLMLDEQ